MKRMFDVEVTVVGTAVVQVEANSQDEAAAMAEESVSVIHAEGWRYDATNVRESWEAAKPVLA